MNATHPLYKGNKEIGKTVPTQVQPTPAVQPAQGLVNPGSTSQGSGSPSISLSKYALTTKIATYERMSINPNAAPVAEAIRQMLLN